MIRNAKATTHKGRKVLESRAPNIEETPKQAIFIRGKKTGTLLNNLLKNLYQLKKPLSSMYKQHNDLRPFEDANSLEFFAQKSNASIIRFRSSFEKETKQFNSRKIIRWTYSRYDGMVYNGFQVDG